jgi:hypothetical protein
MDRSFLFLFFLIASIMTFSQQGFSQMPPPGYDRAVQLKKEQDNIPYLDRDSITVVDTAVIFDPTTYEEETKIISTTYSLRDYCKQFLGMNDPDILMDHQPHTIIDPKTYEDMIIRLNQSGKIDTIPK